MGQSSSQIIFWMVGWSRSIRISCSFISDLEFQRQNSSVVGIFLVSLLSSSDIVLENLVKFSEVDCEVPSTS